MTDTDMKTEAGRRKNLILLLSGEIMKDTIDPDGILASARATDLFHGNAEKDGRYVWGLRAAFPSGEKVHLHGLAFCGIGIYIEGIVFHLPGGETHTLRPAPAETVSDALGRRSGLPHRVRELLSGERRKRAFSGTSAPKYGRKFLLLEDELIFSGCEGGGEIRCREPFSGFRSRFSAPADGRKTPKEATFMKICRLQNGKIAVRTVMDKNGITERSVFLEYDMKGGRLHCRCEREEDGRTIPSIPLAFTAYGRLSTAPPVEERRTRLSRMPPAPGFR